MCGSLFQRWEKKEVFQAVNESFVHGQELRCAKEGFCTMEDAQLATRFGGQVGNVLFPGENMTDSETQKLE